MTTINARSSSLLLGSALLAAAVATSACGLFKKSEGDTSGAAGSQTGSTGGPAGATTPAAGADGIFHYPDEKGESGTVSIKTSTVVRKAADGTSDSLGTLGPGTLVDRKARKGDWVLVNWPSAPGTLTPGWVHGSALGEVVLVKFDAGVKIDAGVDAAKVAAVDAGPTTPPTATVGLTATAPPTTPPPGTAPPPPPTAPPLPPTKIKLPGK